MSDIDLELYATARQEMLDKVFDPDFSPEVDRQMIGIDSQRAPAEGPDVLDLRGLLWSSIDHDTSRDLDQIEVAERVDGGIRVMVAVADVDSRLTIGSPIDRHAAAQTTSVYTGIRTFSMLPERP